MEVLLVANAVEPSRSLEEARRIERETGLRVRYVLSVGGGHHIHLDPWIDAFPEAKVLLPPVRVPRTRHGHTLMQKPPDKVWLMDMARKVKEPAVVAASWKKILAWPMRTLMTYHDPPTHAITSDPRAALEQAAREAKQL